LNTATAFAADWALIALDFWTEYCSAQTAKARISAPATRSLAIPVSICSTRLDTLPKSSVSLRWYRSWK
jgi:hypothetical protein